MSLYTCIKIRHKIIAVIGNSKTGKTTLIEHLISHLTERGLNVGSVKHVHKPNFTIDTPGKDTWRHMKAKAKITASIAETEICIIKKTDTTIYSLGEIVSLFKNEDIDILILEGFRYLVADSEDVLKIITANNIEDLRSIVQLVMPPILLASGKVAESRRVFNGIPLIDMAAEKDKLLKLVEKNLFYAD